MFTASLTWTPSADAAKDVADRTAAARAFAAAQHAQLRGRHREAAENYELADSILPTPEALKSAIRCRIQAGDLARAVTLADKLARRCDQPGCQKLARPLLSRGTTELVRLMVSCRQPCILAVDGIPTTTRPARAHRLFVWPGRYALHALFDNRVSTTVRREGTAGESIVLKMAPPPPTAAHREHPDILLSAPETPPPAETRGLGPVVPLVGFGVAAALGAAATWSFLDTRATHAGYIAEPSPAAWNDGRSRQLRTNVLMWSSITTAAVSTAILLFFTNP